MCEEMGTPFEVKDQNGVKLIFGSLPLAGEAQLLEAIDTILGGGALADFSGIAQHYGATRAVGLAADLNAERQRLGLGAPVGDDINPPEAP
jgi:hypothetical protein